MNYKEIREANKLIDEIKHLDSFTMDVQNPERGLRVSSEFDAIILKREHKNKVMKVLFGIRRELAEELEKLGVTEDYND